MLDVATLAQETYELGVTAVQRLPSIQEYFLTNENAIHRQHFLHAIIIISSIFPMSYTIIILCKRSSQSYIITISALHFR